MHSRRPPCFLHGPDDVLGTGKVPTASRNHPHHRPQQRNRWFADSPLEGTGFEPSVRRQEKWSMPSSSDQTRVGRTLTLGGGAEASPEAETSNSRSRRRHPYFVYDLCADRSKSTTISGGGPMVRIHFPPAASQRR